MRRPGITHRMIIGPPYGTLRELCSRYACRIAVLGATEPGGGAEPHVKWMLTINEIFYSIQGESTRVGQPCVFVRLTACDLRCSWCDTPYAFDEGRKMSVDDVVAAVDSYPCALVEITGSEPLLQEDVYEL